MSNRTLTIDDRLYDYILSVSVDESEHLRDLREETKNVDWSIMQISPEQGQFMSMVVQLIGARRAIEIGTYTGYSSICIATALPEDGQLICCDTSEEWTSLAKKYWQLTKLENKIELHLQEADKTLQTLIDEDQAGQFDFIFIDADKQNYLAYYEQALKLLKSGGLIMIDNTLWSGAVADPDNTDPATRAIRRFNEFVRDDKRVSKCLLPVGDGLTLVTKQIH